MLRPNVGIAFGANQIETDAARTIFGVVVGISYFTYGAYVDLHDRPFLVSLAIETLKYGYPTQNR